MGSEIDVAAELARLALEVRSLKQQVGRLTASRKTPKSLLSLSEAARRMGVSRNDTLHGWIRDRRIKAVDTGGRLKIPVSEVERISSEGIGRAGRHAARV